METQRRFIRMGLDNYVGLYGDVDGTNHHDSFLYSHQHVCEGLVFVVPKCSCSGLIEQLKLTQEQ